MGFFKNEIELEKEGKLTEKDVGYLQDAFENLKNAAGLESHCLGDFVISPSKENLQKINNARRRRTILMELTITSVGAKLSNEEWCEVKHICLAAMGCQECIARHSVVGNLKLSTEYSKMHKEFYLEFLNLMGVNEKNLKSQTSA